MLVESPTKLNEVSGENYSSIPFVQEILDHPTFRTKQNLFWSIGIAAEKSGLTEEYTIFEILNSNLSGAGIFARLLGIARNPNDSLTIIKRIIIESYNKVIHGVQEQDEGIAKEQNEKKAEEILNLLSSKDLDIYQLRRIYKFINNVITKIKDSEKLKKYLPQETESQEKRDLFPTYTYNDLELRVKKIIDECKCKTLFFNFLKRKPLFSNRSLRDITQAPIHLSLDQEFIFALQKISPFQAQPDFEAKLWLEIILSIANFYNDVTMTLLNLYNERSKSF